LHGVRITAQNIGAGRVTVTDLNLSFSNYQIPITPTIWQVVIHSTLGHKIVKHWGILAVGGVVFVITLCVSQEPLTAMAVFRRILDACGDVAFDRGFTPED
jgi:hypothetical protein